MPGKDKSTDTPAMAVTQSPPPTREEARNAILNAETVKIPAKWHGVDIELRPPPVAQMLDMQNTLRDNEGGLAIQTARMLVEFVCLPNGEKLFDEADMEAIIGAQFTGDLQELINKINDLMGVQVTDEDKSTTEAITPPVGGDESGSGTEGVGGEDQKVAVQSAA